MALGLLLALIFATAAIPAGALGALDALLGGRLLRRRLRRCAGLLRRPGRSYEHWGGRFSHIFVAFGLASLGSGTAPLVATLLPFVALGIVTWTLSAFSRLVFGRRLLVWSLLLAEVSLAGWAIALPNRDESLYWLNGASAYTWPLLLFTLHAGLVAAYVSATNPRATALWLGASAVLGFIGAGFSETATCFQLAVLVLAFVACVTPRSGLDRDVRRRLGPFIFAALLAAVAGALVLAAAPGNDVREATLPAHLPLAELGYRSLRRTLRFLYDHAFEPEVFLVGPVVALATVIAASRGRGPGVSIEPTSGGGSPLPPRSRTS